MREPANELLTPAMHLPTEGRAAMAAELLASLDGEPNEDVEAEWAAEIRRRLERIDAGEGKFEDWEIVRDRHRARLDSNV